SDRAIAGVGRGARPQDRRGGAPAGPGAAHLSSSRRAAGAGAGAAPACGAARQPRGRGAALRRRADAGHMPAIEVPTSRSPWMPVAQGLSPDIVIVGLSLSSSWGNGHATTYRSLVKGLSALGWRTLFLEREQPRYAQHRDLEAFPYCELALYTSESELRRRHTAAVRSAVAVIVGSYVAQGVAVGDWVLDTARGVRAFYDIDTPVTLAQLEEGNCSY